ncbi:MAG TPA: hypothetical protein VJR89_33850 [Polyangiales bacterium]|nr:hypothetical protein [Polyangiales bacterium]
MTERVDPPLSSLQVVHACAFSGGLVAYMAAVLTSNPALYLLAGPLLAASGALILLGCRITFRGPLGDIMRVALGRGVVRRATTRGVIWLVLGLLISVWGVTRVRRHDELEQLREPMVMQR